MRNFRDVIRDLLERLRQRPDTERFLPRRLDYDPELLVPEMPPVPPVPPVRHLYRAEPTTWGHDGYDPVQMPLPSGFETRVMPVIPERRPAVQVFRLFDDD